MPSRPGSPSQEDVLPPANPEDQTSEGVWKRRYFGLREMAKVQTKRKSSFDKDVPSTRQIARGIRKVIFICGTIKGLVSESDDHDAYEEDPESFKVEFEGNKEEEVEMITRSWARSHEAVKLLHRLIPGFKETIDKGSPDELATFYSELEASADGARGDDLRRIRALTAGWLNEAQPTPNPVLTQDCRKNRGLSHDTTGRLLCPVQFDWNDLVVRAKIRAGDAEFDWLFSFHSRCFYLKYEGDANDLELGYLKSTLLVRVYKAIFTSPSSAKDSSEVDDNSENIPPAKLQKLLSGKKGVRSNVASKVALNNKVTPRSIAYAAVMLHFNLQDGESWALFYGGFDYEGLYNYIVDFFEDPPGPAANKRAKDLLNWWSEKVFPGAIVHRRSNVSASRQEFRRQRAAQEGRGAAQVGRGAAQEGQGAAQEGRGSAQEGRGN